MNYLKEKIIYDIGAHNGDDVEYYLKKADKVIAAEANPALCALIKKRFSKQINAGHLIVENYIVTDNKRSESIQFYIHKELSVVSTMIRPDKLDDFEQVSIRSIDITKLIEQHGDPYYIKIDIEGHDAAVLRRLFSSGIKPPYISAESHKADIFAILVALGGYSSFQLVEGHSVSSVYNNHEISSLSGPTRHSFPSHSAGPFGEDIIGHWMPTEEFHCFLGEAWFGWKDIHATTEIEPLIENKIRIPKDASMRMKFGKFRRDLVNRWFKSSFAASKRR